MIQRYGRYEGGFINPKPDGEYVKLFDIVELLEGMTPSLMVVSMKIRERKDTIDEVISKITGKEKA